eukprot:scaffold44408_cov28-Tisochrysis_lutea.AAC.2
MCVAWQQCLRTKSARPRCWPEVSSGAHVPRGAWPRCRPKAGVEADWLPGQAQCCHRGAHQP